MEVRKAAVQPAAIPLAAEKNKKSTVRFVIVCVAVAAGLAWLTSKFPLSGDDWGWGSYLGTDLLKSFFKDYNGRYMGNLLVLALTRSKILNIAVKTLTFFAACLMASLYAGSRKGMTLLFSFIVFLSMPTAIFSQSAIWTAGYSNYFIPSLIAAGFVILAMKVFDDTEPAFPAYVTVLTAVAGFFGALFMENITLFNLAVAAAAVIFTKCRYKHVVKAYAGFLIGTAAGCVVMFSNGAYLNVLQKDDTYRAVQTGLADIIEKLYASCRYCFMADIFLLAVITLLLLVCVCLYLRRSEDKRAKKAGAVAAFLVNAAVFAVTLYSKFGDSALSVFYKEVKNEDETQRIDIMLMLFIIALTLLYFSSLIAAAWLCFDKKTRIKMVVPLFCIPVFIAPLLFVYPVGGRCFFGVHLFLMLYSTVLFVSVTGKVRSAHIRRLLYVPFYAVFVIAFFGTFFSLSDENKAFDKRMQYIRAQIDAGETTVLIYEMPNRIVFDFTPRGKACTRKFNAYYGFDGKIKYKIISEKKLDKIMEKRYGLKIESTVIHG